MKTTVSEAEHPLLCEGTRRVKGDLALALMITYKDDQCKLKKVGRSRAAPSGLFSHGSVSMVLVGKEHQQEVGQWSTSRLSHTEELASMSGWVLAGRRMMTSFRSLERPYRGAS